MEKRKNRGTIFFRLSIGIVSVFVLLFSIGCQSVTQDSEGASPPPAGSTTGEASDEQLMDSTFRIDTQTISVVYDYYPDQSYAAGHAEIIFRMRPGQQKPVIHFDPAVSDASVVSLVGLNGEALDMGNSSDIQVISFNSTLQKAIEFQRNLAEGADHTLVMEFRLDLPTEYPRFSVEVNDLQGNGNEERFPCINAPHDLARHKMNFRVHGGAEFRFIGSGLTQKVRSTPVQEWSLDTEVEISSYTVMFVLLPAADTVMEERAINGHNVKVMAFKKGPKPSQAFDSLYKWIPVLESQFGPFPAPHGYQIFLCTEGGGMEYYGGTITATYVLVHETIHQWIGCSTVFRHYRDTWLDEALNQWYEYTYLIPGYPAIEEGFSSNIVSGRSAVAVGCDLRAYEEGSRIIEAMARKLGGRQGMLDFIKYLHLNYSFAPFTTRKFVDYFKEYSGVDMHSQFSTWVYKDTGTVSAHQARSAVPPNPAHQPVNFTPPDHIQQKYRAR